MKDRIKKFYLDHEHTLHIIGTTAGVTTLIVAPLIANAISKGHTIVNATSWIDDDEKMWVRVEKKNGLYKHFNTDLSNIS